MTGFDPACQFLLESSNFESLFEQAGDGAEDHRCKGCRQIVKRWRRLDHFQTHKTLVAREQEARKAELKVERVRLMALARQAKKEAKAA